MSNWAAWTAAAIIANILIAGTVFFFASTIGRVLGQVGEKIISKIAMLLLAAIGTLPGHPHAFKLALIWIAHIAFDRAMGFGLKYGTHFSDTHVGRV